VTWLTLVGWCLLGLLTLTAVLAVVATVRLVLKSRWHRQLERMQLKREMRQAELRLHGLTRRAFEAMLDAARRASNDSRQHQ
jgi:hypothetical protein